MSQKKDHLLELLEQLVYFCDDVTRELEQSGLCNMRADLEQLHQTLRAYQQRPAAQREE